MRRKHLEMMCSGQGRPVVVGGVGVWGGASCRLPPHLLFTSVEIIWQVR